MKHKLTVLIFAIVAGFFALNVYASGEKEKASESGKKTIGVVHITFNSVFSYNSIIYQSFDASYRKEWKRLSNEHDFNLIEVEGGVAFNSTSMAIRRLIALNVDGILLFQHEPAITRAAVKEAQEAGIPVVVHGIRESDGVSAPYVGFDEYGDSYKLGKNFAEYFKKKNPNSNANVLVLNSRTVKSDIDREKGFTDGFKSLIPGADFIHKYEDTGSATSAREVAEATLRERKDINVIFATSDLRAQGALIALRRYPALSGNKIIVAAIGGSLNALKEVTDPNSPWKGEVALSIKEVADKSYEILKRAIDGDIPLKSNEEFLVKSIVFVDPPVITVERYLKENHGVSLDQNDATR